MDGNRRWAREMGLASPSLGHKYGAEHVEDVLHWCQRAAIKHVTVFACSAQNLQRCGDAEIAFLRQVIEDVVAGRLARPEANRQVHIGARLPQGDEPGGLGRYVADLDVDVVAGLAVHRLDRRD
jgi:short-chain Z-isoprenyl diphosphate synthase